MAENERALRAWLSIRKERFINREDQCKICNLDEHIRHQIEAQRKIHRWKYSEIAEFWRPEYNINEQNLSTHLRSHINQGYWDATERVIKLRSEKV